MAQDKSVEPFICQLFLCSPEVATELLAQARLHSFAVGAVILRQGDRTTRTYILVTGRARALMATAGGQLILLHEYHGGDIFGALGELDQGVEDADVVVQEAADTLVMHASHLAMLAQQHGCIGLALARLLMLRLRRTAERLFERASLSSVGRVHAELLRLARLRPDHVISPAPVLADLALVVATTRETASRAVGALERRGIVRREGDSLVVVAPARLEELIL